MVPRGCDERTTNVTGAGAENLAAAEAALVPRAHQTQRTIGLGHPDAGQTAGRRLVEQQPKVRLAPIARDEEDRVDVPLVETPEGEIAAPDLDEHIQQK